MKFSLDSWNRKVKDQVGPSEMKNYNFIPY
jgi:hypothetical protein